MFEIVALEGCPYSQRAVDTLNSLRDTKVIWVNESSKQKYKTLQRNTFPQISFIVKTNQGQLKKVFIGGMSELENLIDLKNQLKEAFGPQVIAPLLHLMKI